MMRECPCSTKTRDGLGNPSPPPSRFPLVMGFAPLDPRGAKPMTAGNLSRFPSTLEISLGLRPREISRVSGNLGRRGWISQSIPRLGGARIQSTYSSRAEKGKTDQDQNAGVRFTTQNCEFMNNLFRKNFCRTMKKFRNCIKNVAKPQH